MTKPGSDDGDWVEEISQTQSTVIPSSKYASEPSGASCVSGSDWCAGLSVLCQLRQSLQVLGLSTTLADTVAEGTNVSNKGIGTENPVLQVGNYVFKGEYKKVLGTAVFFEQDENECWNFKCSTDKMLEMRRVFLQPKEMVSEEPSTSENTSMNIKQPDDT